MPINTVSGPYALEGRVVTMAALGVIERGRVYIQKGVIVAVHAADAPRPDGFTGAPVVKVGGTIFPGLIELHNHLSYNAIPLWDVPKLYAHSGSWQGTDEYKAAITKPAQVLANTAGNVEALVRFVECRCLLGGVTTSQGLTLSSKQGIQSAYKGLVRNVESPLADDLPAAGAKIGAPDKDIDTYAHKLEDHVCYLQHLSEGLGETPRRQFTGLQRLDGSWGLKPSLSGVHSTALTPEDFAVLARPEHRCSIVWSPLSNLLLYGATTDVKAAKAAGVPIALGSDWAPSGTKNLLGELKVAWLVSEEQGGLLTYEELCQMVTTVPAEILGWDHRLGTIEPGRYADLIVLDDTTGDPYRQLVEARETTITLVVIDGTPRLGQSRIMKRFGPGTEEIQVGSSKRLLDLTPSVTPDPTGGITLTEATRRLRDTLARLPELAEHLDTALAAGWSPSTPLALRVEQGLADLGLPADWQAPAFTVALDFEPEDVARNPSFALGAGRLAEWVDPMVLEGITVADDPDFFRKLARAGNLPAYIKRGLPSLHGVRIPSIAFLEAQTDALDLSVVASRELREVPMDGHVLRAHERLRIVDEAAAMLGRHYVHLPMKRAMHAIDPLQRLRLLRYHIEQDATLGALSSDLDFHLEMSAIFGSLRDLHTTYRLPLPYRRQVAWLPYLIEEYQDGGQTRFLVSKVIGKPGPDSFVAGVEVLHWNGTSIDRVVDQLARTMLAGNPAARRARAINALTVRPLGDGSLPAEEWVTLRFRTLTDPPRVAEYQQPWLLFEPSRRWRVLQLEDANLASTGIGLDDGTDAVQQAKKLLYAGATVEAEESALARGETLEVALRPDEIPTQLPTLFRARHITPQDGENEGYGYLRIFSFNVDDADTFIGECERLLRAFPKNGLILDLRGNAGGLIHAAERLLELVSPRPIEPARAQFINTPANLDLCRRHGPSPLLPGFSLRPWTDSIAASVATGATYSLGFPLTDPATCNQRGQCYQGPVVLVVDGLCYSATDIFAAGFQDHQLGQIIGIHANIGAGGANVWSHALLRQLADPQAGLQRLPGTADLRVAVRRTLRVGPNAGQILEDVGIRPDTIYRLTRDDLLHGNRGLIDTAISLLRRQSVHRLTVTETAGHIEILTCNVEWIAATFRGRALRARDVIGDQARIDLAELSGQRPGVLEVIGMQQDQPVVRVRIALL
jgi:cytosine/adenosine deaminase-related metal-dependent hydrolase